jgi:histidine triad (HIT) family protein
MDKSCVFCRIALGEERASIVYDDGTVLVFMDANPINVGHTLVVPKEHWETIYELPEDTLTRLFSIVKKIAIAAKRAVKADGINIVQSNEKAATQFVGHLHVHVIPRFREDDAGRPYSFIGAHGRSGPVAIQDLDETAKKIHEEL